jgi:hypothetical protein
VSDEYSSPTMAAFWGDTRKLLSHAERTAILPTAKMESLTPTEILLRDTISQRLVVITSIEEGDIFCDLCDQDRTRRTYGKSCPRFAYCIANHPLVEQNKVTVRQKKNGQKGR